MSVLNPPIPEDSAVVGQREPRRQLTPEELGEIVREHASWLDSNRAVGRKAERFYCSFQGLLVSNLKLDEAVFVDCDFSGCDLSETFLLNATLRDSQFSGARLTKCVLRGADLTNADFTMAEDITAPQLARTILVGTKLPDVIESFDNLLYLDKLSEVSQKLLTVMTLMVAYCWLTVANTQDVAAFTTGNAAELPIIKTSVPLVVVYAGAPLLLILNYLYIHIYLQRLWEGLCGLPYVFPDGVPLRQKINPWILNGFVAEHLSAGKTGRRPLSTIQQVISSLLAWWLVPITIALMWIRYLRRQDLLVSVCQSVALAIAVFAAFYLYRLASNTLLYRGSTTRDRNVVLLPERLSAVCAGLTALCLALAATVSYKETPPIEGLTIIHFEGGDLSITSEKAPERATKSPVAGALLQDLNLRRLQAPAAYLAYANLDNSDLRDGNLGQAVLEHVHAVNTKMQRTDLSGSHLAFADFRDADFDSAILRNAHFENAELLRANLHGADLSHADLRNTGISANMDQANLSGIDLTGGGLPYSNLTGANLNQSKLIHANLSYAIATDAILTDANLCGADLTETDLRGASLQWANFAGAILARTELQGANLADAKNLSTNQIAEAIIDGNTVCPESVKTACAEIIRHVPISKPIPEVVCQVSLPVK